jgi:hypothetical protein
MHQGSVPPHQPLPDPVRLEARLTWLRALHTKNNMAGIQQQTIDYVRQACNAYKETHKGGGDWNVESFCNQFEKCAVYNMMDSKGCEVEVSDAQCVPLCVASSGGDPKNNDPCLQACAAGYAAT